LSHAPARQWVAEQFERIVEEFDVEYFEQDFETIARCDRPGHGHQLGDSEYRNTLALWELIDGVRARHPNVMIENNWSGARVMDFGMLQRYDAALCDDYNQAARNRGASFGVTHFLPPAFVSKYMGAEALPLDYQTRSYFFGGPWNLMTDLPTQDAAQLSAAVNAYKGLRSLIRDGRVYHLQAPSFNGTGWNRYQIAWDAIEVVEAGGNRAVLLIGRGLAGPATLNVKPRGLNPAIVYDLIASSGAAYGRRSGSDLMANGIDVSLPERSHETVVLTQLTQQVFLPAVMRGE
jgi:alpha-galactosidase